MAVTLTAQAAEHIDKYLHKRGKGTWFASGGAYHGMLGHGLQARVCRHPG